MVMLDDGQTAAAGIHAGVGIRTVFQQQLRDFQVVSAAGLKQSSALRSQVLRKVGIGALLQQKLDDVWIAFATRTTAG